MFYSQDIKDKNILLHACCGPCSLGAIEPLLADGARISVFFYDPCIIDGEFEKRLEALRTVCAHYSLPLIVPEHDYSHFSDYGVALAFEREGGARCSLCMTDRLTVSASFAESHGFDAYTTTLTVSPHKNSKLIFSIAEGLSVGAPFLARDFKKRNGFLLSTRRSSELGIYRQSFCGCEFSLAEASAYAAKKSAGERA